MAPGPVLTVHTDRHPPRFESSHQHHFAFTVDLYECLFSLTGRNLKRMFTSVKKVESKNSVERSLCSEPSRGSACGAPGGGSGPAKLLPHEPHTPHLHRETMPLNCVSICVLSRFILCIC